MMTQRLITIAIVLAIALLGFILRFVDYRRISKRIETTYEYQNKFVEFLKELIDRRNFDYKNYIWLMENVNKMQDELGSDGVYAYMHDPLRGMEIRNYQILINFLPKLRNFVSETNMFPSIMTEAYAREASCCDDGFIRHIGTLNSRKDSIHKLLLNPIQSFSYGVENVLFIPVSMLSSLGLFSAIWVAKMKNSIFAKLLVGVVALIAFLSSVVTVLVGWEEFTEIVSRLFHKQ